MENGTQIVFNIMVVGVICVVVLVGSYRAKMSKMKGINPAKEQSTVLGETLGVGVMLLFLIFGVFAVGFWGS